MAKQFLLLFAGTFFISLFVLMMQFLWRYVDDLIGKGLSVEVLGQFFWYMSLMLVPQALPLAVLLASLISMGNIGEKSELTAIKAAGISLMQALRSQIVCAILIMCCSFYFQNYVAPEANRNMSRLLSAMKQKSPELEIPEGIFYDGIPNSNLYVQKKNLETGKLYGVMIYRMNGSFEDAAIILADSGMLQSTADREHLQLTLYSGEWFENMSHDVAGNSNVPYRRESFMTKRILMDFDDGFDLADANNFTNMAQAKSIGMILHSLDSLNNSADSASISIAGEINVNYFDVNDLNGKDSLKAIANADKPTSHIDTVMLHMETERKREAYQRAYGKLQMMQSTMEYYGASARFNEQIIREHWIEAVNKYSLALTCLIFFFIGAPLGAIIRKGGLGVPVIISVLVFIVFYILDNTGYRMARLGAWPVWLGKGIAPAVLIPLATFVTYKANKDSAVFNMDAYRNFFIRLLGLRLKRIVNMKEVIINDPDYVRDAELLNVVSQDVQSYAEKHKLKWAPNIIKVFFQYEPDMEIPRITQQLDTIIEDLGNSRDRFIIEYLNRYPIVSEKAHTRPFERKWMNIAAFIIVPAGIFLYLRMWRFRLRLLHDLRNIKQLNDLIIQRIEQLNAQN